MNNRKRVVVFDVDDCIAKKIYDASSEEIEVISARHPECPMFMFSHEESDYPHSGDHIFIYDSIDHGLAIVRKKYKDAIFYGQEKRDEYPKQRREKDRIDRENLRRLREEIEI